MLKNTVSSFLNEIIAYNPLSAVKSGLCQRKTDGAIYLYSQNSIELKNGWLLLAELDQEGKG